MAKKKTSKKRKNKPIPKEPTRNIHFRELDSRLYYPEEYLTADFRAFFKTEVWPLLLKTTQGYNVKEKKSVACQIAHNLITTGLTNRTVADSRNFHKNFSRIKIWDTFIEAGLCKMCLGSQSSRKVTRYYATNLLLGFREKWELSLLIDIGLKRNTERVRPTRQSRFRKAPRKPSLFAGPIRMRTWTVWNGT